MHTKPDHWLRNSVIYQIYPRSFKDSNGDGIGDLQGIIQQLDYLQDLGINAIWLSPIYPSPMFDFGYDVADYCNIDPIFGDLDDFDQLVKESHKRGIKVLMDYIPNHTSSHHPWFLESRSSKDNPKRDWYIWKDAKPNGDPPTNWVSVFWGSAWHYDNKTEQYYLHTFDKEQPDLNWRNPEVVEAMLNVFRFWLDRGVDGFRVDAVYFLFKDDKFLDEPINPNYKLGTHEPYDQLLHPYTFAQPETVGMIKRFAEVLEEYEHKFMVIEAYIELKELIKIYSVVSREWFAPFNFSFITHPWRADVHKEMIDHYDLEVGKLYFPAYVLGNHDKPRIASRVGELQAKSGAILLLSLRGIPFIYYGDELGMKDGIIPSEKIQDPFEKNNPGLGLGRDPVRTPMQWTDSLHADFSTVEPWLPLSANYENQNVKNQQSDPTSFLSLYKKLIHIRKNSTALLYGEYISFDTGYEHVYGFLRDHEKEKMLTLINYSDETKELSLPFKEGIILCNSGMDKVDEHTALHTLTLKPHEAYIIKITA